MKIIPNTFTRYELTAQEALSGRILNDSQLAILHNMRTDAAEQKLNLTFDANNMVDFAQQEAFLAGQIQLLGSLIDGSAEAQKEVANPKPPQEV